MKRLEGGYLGGRPTWSLASNPGIWGIEQVYARRAAGTWPSGGGAYDEFYEYVTFTLHANGTNGSTSFPDSSLLGNAVAVNGNAQVSTAQSKFGGSSIAFDGNGDYLVASSSSAFALQAGDWTIECWVYFNVLSGFQNIVDFRTTSGSAVCPTIYTSGTGLIFAAGSSNVITPADVLITGSWYHIAVAKSAGSTRMFLNGTQVGSTYADSNSYVNNSSLNIGRYPVSNTSFVNGYIDELRITKGYARYTSNFSVPAGPYEDEGASLADPFYNYVSLLLPMNGSNNSTTFTDKSPNALTVTANGDAKLSTAVKRYGVSSAYFDGDNDWLTAISSGLAFGTGDFTIECFVRWVGDTASGNASAIVIDFRTAEPSTQILVYITSSASSPARSIRLFVNGADRIGSTTLATQNIWRHFALVRSAGTTTMYIDGVSQGTWADTSNYSGTTAYIGGRFAAVSGDQRSLNGYIDDLRVTKGVARYIGNFIPPLPHADYGTLADPYLAASTLWMPMEGPVNSTGFFDRADRQIVTTVGNAKISNAQYKWGLTSAFFDGSNDGLTVPSSSGFDFGTGDFTIEFWVYPTALSGANRGIVCKGWPNIGSWLVYYNNTSNRLELYVSSNNTAWDIASAQPILTTPSLNRWYHIAITRSGTAFRAFIDGAQTLTFTSSASIYYSASQPVGIGGDQNGASSMGGYIDDLRIIKGHARYTANFTPPTAPINADTSSDPYLGNVSLLLKMDGANNSTTFTDSSLTPKAVFANGNVKISTAQSKFGGSSALFDGTGDYLSIASDNTLSLDANNFTIEAWIYLSAKVNNYGTIIGNNPATFSSGATFFMAYGASSPANPNKLGFGTFTTNPILVSTTSLDINNWYHVAVTRDGTAVRLFINGTHEASATNSESINLGLNGTRIGSNGWDGSASFFQGYIDDLRITKGIARYTANFIPPTIGHPVWNVSSMDPDAATYITAVEAADAQALEDPVKIAIDQFVRGCKYDNIWTAIKACCILAGARTLNGALVPLVGTAPTNVNFVSGDYNRETGLVGDGSTKYLNSNRNNNVDPQNSKHVSVFITEAQTRDITRAAICSRQTGGTTGATHLVSNDTVVTFRVNTTGVSQVTDNSLFTGLYGASRSTSASVARRLNGSSATFSETSSTPTAVPIDIFSRNGADFSNGRFAFYSIGESLDLEKLDTRVTALVAAIGAAIA
jgi:hypothetical protein